MASEISLSILCYIVNSVYKIVILCQLNLEFLRSKRCQAISDSEFYLASFLKDIFAEVKKITKLSGTF